MSRNADAHGNLLQDLDLHPKKQRVDYFPPSGLNDMFREEHCLRLRLKPFH